MKSAIAMLAMTLIVAGCSTWGNGKVDLPLANTPYQAGRTFVFVDTITEPFQHEELAEVIDQVYALAMINLDEVGESTLDEIVRAQIEEVYSESTPATQNMIFEVYKAVFARITYQVEINPDLPDIEVLKEFNRGIVDALAIYQPKTDQSDE